MCYEFESWHWKARANEFHKAQMKSSADEQKTAAPKQVDETERRRPEVKEPDKTPA
jgi:hypothetical protein